MALSSLQKERYQRHVIVPEIGEEGQQKLISSSALIVGCGGLGSASAFYLSASGLGRIGLLDKDIVEPSNLQRQILHSEEKLGMPKTESACKTLSALNSSAKFVRHFCILDEAKAEEIFPDYDLIIDGTDNLETRYIINRICLKLKKPAVFGAVYSFCGQLTSVIPGESPCYRCIFLQPDTAPSSKPTPVVSALPGIIGSMQALEAVKILTGCKDLLAGKLLTFDGIGMEWETVKYNKNPLCPDCGES